MKKKIKILFDEELHKYTDIDGNVYTSVTQLITKYEHVFDNEFWAMYRALDQVGYKLKPDTINRKIFVKNKWYNLPELYAGIIYTIKTPAQITKEWKDITQRSLDRGNKKHNYLEDCINAFYNNTENSNVANFNKSNDHRYKIKIEDVFQLENSPLKFSHPKVFELLRHLIIKGYILYAEQRVYSYEHLVSGTIDVLAIKGKLFYIIDWKTNKDKLEFRTGYYKKKWTTDRKEKVKTSEFVYTNTKFKYPLNKLPYNKGNVYTLQLSLYAYICELWGLKCNGLILFHLREDDEKVYDPVPYKIKYIKQFIKILMDVQQKTLNYS